MSVQLNNALMTIKEFGEWSRLGRTKIYELIKRGEIAAIKIGCRTYIRTESAEVWLAGQPCFGSQQAA